MARQHIGLGTTANDGTGDSLRAGGDKINDNFIELYAAIDELPGAYWPLGGVADLTDDVVIDGNDFDVTFGSPNSLDAFSVFANNSIYLEVDNGFDTSTFNILPDSIDFATGEFGVTGFADFLLDVTSGIQIIYYDASLDASSIVFGVGGEMNISGVTGTIGFDDLLIGGTLVGFDIPLGLKSYTVAGLPPPTSAGLMAFCSNDVGGQVPVFSDNAGNWRRVTDGNIAST